MPTTMSTPITTPVDERKSLLLHGETNPLITDHNKTNDFIKGEMSSRPSSTRQQTHSLLDPHKETPWRFEMGNEIQTGFLKPSAPLSRLMSIDPARNHNETVNIYSHLVPGLIFVCLAVQLLASPPAYMTSTDVLVSNIYAAGTTCCFIFSALHHGSTHISRKFHYYTAQLDVVGIVCLMSSAAVPMIYYGLFNRFYEQWFYYAATCALAVGCCAALLVPESGHAPVAALRISMFTGLSVPGVAAIIHGRYITTGGIDRPISLGWIGATALLNASGALLYGSKFPEKYFQKTFDIWGSSHQIFHILIAISAFVFWSGLMKTIETIRTW